MHDIKWIRDNPEDFDKALNRRPLSSEDRERFSAQSLLQIDAERRKAVGFLESALARRNAASKEIGDAKKRKDDAHAQDLMDEVTKLKAIIPELEKTPRELETKLDALLAQIPNVPLESVPRGVDEHSNVVLEGHTHAIEKRLVDESGQSYLVNAKGERFKPKEHFELGADLGMMDFELAAKLSGARFVVLQKGLARLERALGQFFLDTHTADAKRNEDGTEVGGYTEVNPPLMVKDNVMFGTAQLPKFEDDQYLVGNPAVERLRNRMTARVSAQIRIEENKRKLAPFETNFANNLPFNAPDVPSWVPILRAENDNISTIILQLDNEIADLEKKVESISDKAWLIPTAEVPLTNLVREQIVDESTLPRRYTACTPCFRAEAGAAGRDTRGMIRQHQFTKVELVSITTPEKSKEEHERMLSCAEEVLKLLGLHYRVITLCTGDMGFASQKTYDIEVWLPGQNAYREISSCSVCGDFQARRMNARYRGKDGKPAFVHTLNGSGVAVGRALIAVMETYQQEDGSILVPDVLRPSMGGMTKIEKK